MKNLLLEVKKTKEALLSLQNIYNKEPAKDRIIIDATIKRFESAFDLFWKTLRIFFYYKGLNIHYPKDILKQAYVTNLLDDELLWLRLLQDTNLTSHSYDDILADEIFQRIQKYVPLLTTSFDKIDSLVKNLQYDA